MYNKAVIDVLAVASEKEYNKIIDLTIGRRVRNKAEIKYNFLERIFGNDKLLDMVIDYNVNNNIGELIEILVKLRYDNKAIVSKANSVDLKTNRFAYEIKFQPKGSDLASSVNLDKIANDVLGIIFITFDKVYFLNRNKFEEAKKHQTKQGKFNHSFLTSDNKLLTETKITKEIAQWLCVE